MPLEGKRQRRTARRSPAEPGAAAERGAVRRPQLRAPGPARGAGAARGCGVRSLLAVAVMGAVWERSLCSGMSALPYPSWAP